MTKIKEQAIELLRDIPDEKIVYIIDILKGLKGLLGSDNNERAAETKRQSAKGVLSKYANADLIPQEKDAWSKVVKEKHANN